MIGIPAEALMRAAGFREPKREKFTPKSLTDLILIKIQEDPELLHAIEKSPTLLYKNQEKLNEIIAATEAAAAAWLKEYCPAINRIENGSRRELYAALFYGLYLRSIGTNVTAPTSHPLLEQIKTTLIGWPPVSTWNNPMSDEAIEIHKLLRQLLCSNEGINAKDANGYTLLHQACEKDTSGTLIALMYAAGASIEAQTNKGNRALHIAAQHLTHHNAIKQLLQAGAEAAPKNNKERSPRDLANQEGRQVLSLYARTRSRLPLRAPLTYLSKLPIGYNVRTQPTQDEKDVTSTDIKRFR